MMNRKIILRAISGLIFLGSNPSFAVPTMCLKEQGAVLNAFQIVQEKHQDYFNDSNKVKECINRNAKDCIEEENNWKQKGKALQEKTKELYILTKIYNDCMKQQVKEIEKKGIKGTSQGTEAKDLKELEESKKQKKETNIPNQPKSVAPFLNLE